MSRLVIDMDLKSYEGYWDQSVSFTEVQSDIDHAMDSLYGNPLALTIPVRHHDRQVGTISYTKEG